MRWKGVGVGKHVSGRETAWQVLVEAETEDGSRRSIILQNAETVRPAMLIHCCISK